MGTKAESLLRNSAIGESTGRRAAPAAMPGVPAAAIREDPRDVGVSRSKVAQVIRLEAIQRDPGQPREEFDDEALARLADSLREDGVLQPIAVRWDEGRGAYVVVAGERRWRAAKLAGLESIPCTVLDREFGPGELLALQCKENLLRDDLKPIEQARAFRTLMDIHGWSGVRLSREMGVSQGKVTQSLALLDLPPSVQDAVEAGGLSATAAYEVSKLDDPAAQAELAGAAADQGLTRSEVAEAVRSIRARRPAPAARPEPFVFDAGAYVVTIKWKKPDGTTPARALAAATKEAKARERDGSADAA